jgi:hypothetical protein
MSVYIYLYVHIYISILPTNELCEHIIKYVLNWIWNLRFSSPRTSYHLVPMLLSISPLCQLIFCTKGTTKILWPWVRQGFLRYDTKPQATKEKKSPVYHQNKKLLCFKWHHKESEKVAWNVKTVLQIMYLMRDFYLEHVKTLNSIIKRPHNLKKWTKRAD